MCQTPYKTVGEAYPVRTWLSSWNCAIHIHASSVQEVASDFMTEADPGHPGGFLEPSGGFKGLIHNG